MYSHLEDYIFTLYKSIGITQPTEIDLLLIAKKLGVEIVYSKTAFRFDNEINLVRGTKCEEWMEFGHEICHFLRHSGCQLNLDPLFVELQEWQADNFAMQFCVPTFMLQRIRLPPDHHHASLLISEIFNVDLAFAEKRLYRYLQKFYSTGLQVNV